MGLLGGLGQTGKKAVRAKPRQGVAASVRVPGRSIAPRRPQPKGVGRAVANVGGGKKAARQVDKAVKQGKADAKRAAALKILSSFQKRNLAGLPAGHWKSDPLTTGLSLGIAKGTKGAEDVSKTIRDAALGGVIADNPAIQALAPGLSRAVGKGRSAIEKQGAKELSGTGGVAKLGEKAAKEIGNLPVKDVYAPPLFGSTKAGAEATGASGFPKPGKAKGAGILAAAPAGYVKQGGLGYNAIRNLVELPAQAIPSVYLPTKAAVNAAKGNPHELDAYVKEFTKHDPAGALLTGHPGRTLENAYQNPVNAALEASGGYASAGRIIRGGARFVPHPAVRKAVRSTVREDLQVPGASKGIKRGYSRNPLTKGLQVGLKKIAEKQGKNPNIAGERSVTGLQLRDREIPLVRKHEINRRVDEDLALAQARRQEERAKLGKETKQASTGLSRSHKQAAPLVAQNYIRSPETVKVDLETYRRQLNRESGTKLSHDERRTRKQTLKTVEGLLKDQKFLANPEPAFKTAETFQKAEAPRQAKQVETGYRAPKEQLAAEVPYAVVHEGMKFETARKPTTSFDPQATVKSIKRQLRKQTGKQKVANADLFKGVREAQKLKREGAPAAQINAAIERAKTAEQDFGRYQPASKPHVVAKREGTGSQIPQSARSSGPGFVTKEGTPISLEEIRNLRRSKGVKEPALISLRPHARGRAGRYYKALTSERLTAKDRRRTGRSVQTGAADIHPQTMVEQAAESGSINETLRAWDKLAGEYGLTKPNGQAFRGKEARQAADELVNDPHTGLPRKNTERLVPMRVGGKSPKTQKILANLKDEMRAPDERMTNLLSEALLDKFKSDAPGNYVLVPEKLVQRIKEHQSLRSPATDFVRDTTRLWRDVVLAGSTKWIFGNAATLGIQSAVEGFTPADFYRGAKVIKKLEKVNPEAARDVRHRVLGGTMYSDAELSAMHRNKGRVLSSPPGKAVNGAWNVWKQMWFKGEHKLEVAPLYGALGKAARRHMQEIADAQGKFVREGHKGLEDFVNGLQDTPAQRQVARYAEQVVGRWGKASPLERNFLIAYTPFGQWLRVALKYVYVTLPTKHPIKTAILAGLENMTEQERQKLGLTLFPAKGQPAVPEFLQGSINKVRTQGFSPFGVMANPAGIPDFVLPQFSGPSKAIAGFDWKGSKLVDKDGKELDPIERTKIALNLVAEGWIPLLGTARRLREKGGTSQPTSTILSPQAKNQGKDVLDAINRIYNPLRAVGGVKKPKKQSGGFTSKSTTKGSSDYLFKSQGGGGPISGGKTTGGTADYLFK